MDIIKENAVAFHDRIAVKSDDCILTYAQLVEKCNRLTNALRDLGIQKGDRIAVMIPNSPEYIISFCSVLNLGGIAVPINPLNKGRDISHRLNDSEAKILIMDHMCLDRYLEVKEGTNVTHVILVQPFFVQGKTDPLPNENEFYLSYESLISNYSSNVAPDHIDVNDTALLCYTGGTTGVSKGAMLTHKSMVASIFQLFEMLVGLEKGKETIPMINPASHISGLNCVMNLALATAQTLIVRPRFSVADILKMIEMEQITMMSMVPTLYIRVLNHSDFTKCNLKSLKVITSGGASLPLEVQEQFEKLSGSNVTTVAYGLTECSPGVGLSPIGGIKRESHNGIRGILPLPDTDYKIVDISTGTTEVPVGEEGELIVQGPQVMKGYWNKPEENKIALRNGWLYTGDVAYRDEDGFIYVVDRKKDVIITGGYNVYPREVEEVLYEMPEIQECAVIGVPHEDYRETVKAVVVLKEGQKLTHQAIIHFCQQRLTKYKCPTVVEIREELPKSEAGKILKRELRILDEGARTSL